MDQAEATDDAEPEDVNGKHEGEGDQEGAHGGATDFSRSVSGVRSLLVFLSEVSRHELLK